MDGTDFPATGCRLETTQRILPHESARTTKLDACRDGGAILDGVEEVASDPKRAPDRPGIIGNIQVE